MKDILRYTVEEDSCLIWTGATNRGYGIIREPKTGRHLYVHRLVYKLVNGSITDDLHVHHLCHNPLCVNVEHMRLLPKAEHHRQHGRYIDHARRIRNASDKS